VTAAPRVCQRWRGGRASYRPARETINPRDFEIAPVDRVSTRDFVGEHHYAKTLPSNRFRYAIYARGGALVGVAVFGNGGGPHVLGATFPGAKEEVVDLGRLVLLDHVLANAETFLLGRCFELLRREGIEGVLSFSDPVPRRLPSGAELFPGHIGTAYQAHNAVYLGRSDARTLHLFPDLTVLHNRSAAKVRKLDRSCQAGIDQLLAWGASPLEGDPAVWFETWRARLTTPLYHTGNHRYAWAFSRAWKRHIERLSRERAVPLARLLPYPKRLEVLS
jgi:hypothetical protein